MPTIQVRVTDEAYAELGRVAREAGETISDVVMARLGLGPAGFAPAGEGGLDGARCGPGQFREVVALSPLELEARRLREVNRGLLKLVSTLVGE